MDWFRAITQTHTILDYTPEEDNTPLPNPDSYYPSKINLLRTILEHLRSYVAPAFSHSWFSYFSFSSWNFDIETTLLELLFTYNKFCIQLHQRIQTMNANYAVARYVTCCVHSLSLLCGFVFRYMFFTEPTKQCQEPDESWVNIVCLYRTPRDNTTTPQTTIHEHFLDTNAIIDTPDAHYYIEETYQNYDHEELGDEFGDPTYIHPDEHAEMQYAQACNTATRILKQEPSIEEIVVWSRDTHRNEQIVRIWSMSSSSFPDFEHAIRYSKVEFLHIDYRHPKMGDVGIELTIPKHLMIVGNELFSPGFLYRWLKYFSNVPFVFDDAYCVYLMDDNVNQHILRYGDYIVLGETTIEVFAEKRGTSFVVNRGFACEDLSSKDNEVARKYAPTEINNDNDDNEDNDDEYESVEYINNRI